MLRSRLQKLGCWFGLLAILLTALAPAVSQGLAAHERLSVALSANCSANTGPSAPAVPRQPALHLDACDYCSLAAAHAAAPPPANATALHLAPGAVAPAVVLLAAPPAPLRYSVAQPRAPPTLS